MLLEDFPRARATDPSTSHAGLAKMPFDTIADRVYETLAKDGPMHSVALALKLNERLVCVSPVLRPMVRAGLLREAGKAEGKILWAVV
jgi:hypothetical protein